MMRRIPIVAVLLAILLMATWAQAGAGMAPIAQPMQATYPPPGPGLEITVVVPTSAGQAAPAPTGMPLSTTVIIGLLIILVVAVIVGGMALMSRGRQ